LKAPGYQQQASLRQVLRVASLLLYHSTQLLVPDAQWLQALLRYAVRLRSPAARARHLRGSASRD
jgi:hypothetical protein